MNYTREQKSRGGRTTQRLRRQHEARIIELMMQENTITVETPSLIARYMREAIKEMKKHGLALDLTDEALISIASAAEDEHWNPRLPREERHAAGYRMSAARDVIQARAWQKKLNELVNIAP
jgi:predicted GNAT family acetyltransferase